MRQELAIVHALRGWRGGETGGLAGLASVFSRAEAHSQAPFLGFFTLLRQSSNSFFRQK